MTNVKRLLGLSAAVLGLMIGAAERAEAAFILDSGTPTSTAGLTVAQSTEALSLALLPMLLVRLFHRARGLATGSIFKLKNHPRGDQNREYLITGVSLHADAGEFAATGIGAGGGGSAGVLRR